VSKRGGDVLGWIVAPLLAVALLALPLPETVVEDAYSDRLYWGLQGLVTGFSNLAPFAWIDVFLVGAVLLVGWRMSRLVRVAKSAGVGIALWEGVRRTLRAAGVLVLLFLIMWGLNYRRAPLERVVPRVTTISTDDLRQTILNANALGARLRPAQDRSIPSFELVVEHLQKPLNEALVKLGRMPLETSGRPKYSLLLTPLFTWAGVDGMIDPYALESIVHPDLLPFERPITIAHEWSHLAGVADEAEASAVGWLGCMSGGPDLAYSANVFLILEAGSALPRDVWRQVSRGLDPGIRADLAAIAERQRRQRPIVQRTAFRVYDEYLRANHVEAGIASYNQVLTFILSPTFRERIASYRGSHESS
jgi:hypothetical protein